MMEVQETVFEKMQLIGGVDLHYIDRGSGPALLFLHGAGGVASLGPLAPLLAAEYRLLAPSMPGFDDTPQGDYSTIDQLVTLLAEFVEKVAGGPVYLAAQSFGTRVAVWLALKRPDLVRKLLLSAPAALAKTPPKTPDDPAEARAFIARALYGIDAEKADQLVLEKMRLNTRMLHPYMSSLDRETVLARLGELSVPVLILWATQDTSLGEEAGSRFYIDTVPDVRVVEIDSGHQIPAGAPDKWVANAVEFFA